MTPVNPYAAPMASNAAPPDVSYDPKMFLATPGVRLIGSILDGLIFAACFWVPLLFGTILHNQTAAIFGVLIALVGLVGWAVVTIRLALQNGQTIAKRVLGIKVVSADGSPVDLVQLIVMRNLVNGLLGLIPFYGLVDALMIFGANHQCIHDRLAGTLVIKA